MHLTMSYFDGRLVEAIILALSGDRMRISIPDSDDAIELTLAQGVWTTENHEPVELESIVSETDRSLLFAQIRPLTRTAAGRIVI